MQIVKLVSPLLADHGASICQQLFMEIRDTYRDYIHVYTDGSRDRNYVAFTTGFVGWFFFFFFFFIIFFF